MYTNNSFMTITGNRSYAKKQSHKSVSINLQSLFIISFSHLCLLRGKLAKYRAQLLDDNNKGVKYCKYYYD